MLPESKCPIDQRFLFTQIRLSDEQILLWQTGTKEFCIPRNLDKSEAYHQFVNWKKTPNEIALYLYGAYANLDIPKKFTCLFDYNNPSRFIKVKMNLTQSIFDGRFPIDCIESGHKHLGIFEFKTIIPEIIFEMFELTEVPIHIPQNALILAICQFEHYEIIRNHLINKGIN